jgi:hypothetical protein
MVAFQKQTPQPPKTKAELREMLAQAVRNTQPEPKRGLPRLAKIGEDSARRLHNRPGITPKTTPA